jgi:prepilin-type N-terminal cleavage/methylation domain-containing protein
MKYKFSGFTLAEVLITLLIIGVVSSLVIPAIINDTQKAELRTAAKKEFAIAQTVYNLAATENGSGFSNFFWGTSSYTKFNAIKEKMNVVKSCDYGTNTFGNCWAKDGVGMPGYNNINIAKFDNSSTAQGTNASFVAGDGSFWMLYCYTATTGYDRIAVDVNGNKGPNDWGEDVFIFLMPERKLNLRIDNILMRRDGTTISDFRYFLNN